MEALASSPIACVLGGMRSARSSREEGWRPSTWASPSGRRGFSRTVAVKRLLPPFARDPEFLASFVDEARLAARIRHPNVVPTLDVLAQDGELFVVMEYVHGESLARLVRAAAARAERIPLNVVSAIIAGALHGLHAAHEARDERGAPLHLVHRDVSPQNVLVGADGVTRVLDFGIAKAAGRAQLTREGQIKGKLAYMAPEQLRESAERASDIYATGVCLWEALAMRRLFAGDNESAVLARIMAGIVEPPSRYAAELPPALEALTLRALRRDPGERFATAREMARSIESAVAPASTSEVGEWVERLAAETLTRRMNRIAELEASNALGSCPRPLAAPAVGPSPERRPDLPAPPAAAPPLSGEILPATSPSSAVSTRHGLEAAPRRRSGWIVLSGLCVLLTGAVILATVLQGARTAAMGARLRTASAVGTTLTNTAQAALPLPGTGSAATDAAPAASGPQEIITVARQRQRPAALVAPRTSCDLRTPWALMVSDTTRSNA